jgi:hypothetical protein
VVTKQPVLIMIQGPEPGSFYKLPDNRVTTIGRSSRNTIRTVSNSVSRFHCEVAWVNGRWELSDLNSKKGTIVNGMRIDDKHVLQPGDIVRLSTTVFRFDMIEESKLRDRAMLAIVEAEMDVRLAPKGEAAASLDDIRARSRLEVLDSRRRRDSPVPDRLNLIVLAASAATVGLIVAGLLILAHRRAEAAAVNAEKEAAALYRQALAAAHSGDQAVALKTMEDVVRRFPGTPTAAAAAAARTDILWTAAEQELTLAPQREAEGDDAAALQAYAKVEALHPDEALKQLLRAGRDYTVRLARARFQAIEATAERELKAGRPEAALAAYREARDHIGVPELVDKAKARIAELQPAD